MTLQRSLEIMFPKLFEFDALAVPPPTRQGKSVAMVDTTIATSFTAEARAELRQAVSGLDKSVHIASRGAFSMHQLAFHILGLTGPAQLFATTWAINEDVVSLLLRAQQQGLLTGVHFLFDWRVRKYKPKAYALASSNFTTHVVSLHAKVCVIQNEQHSVAVVGSANWTRNSKIEAYYVCVDKDVANFWRQFIDEQIQRGAAERN